MLENKFTKIDGTYYVVGPDIEAGECIGDFVTVTLASGETKEVLITDIKTNTNKKKFFDGGKKLGIPATKKEEQEYCGDCDDGLDGTNYGSWW